MGELVKANILTMRSIFFAGPRVYLFLLWSFGLQISSAAVKPNILIIFADDIGYEALECYGGKDFHTPQLNRMAAEGLRFARAYTSPVCTPSRVSLHTGVYASRHGFTTVLPVHKGTSKMVNFTRLPTFAQLLRSAGYATSVTGKWQLATLEKHPDHPKSAGYDSWALWQIWRDGAKRSRYWAPYTNVNGHARTASEEVFGPDVLSDFVIEQMRSAKQKDQPFLILHNEMLPHDPVTETPDDRVMKRPALLTSMVEYLDKKVGHILDEIENLGLRDNTWVFFIGDNGTEPRAFQRTAASPMGEARLTERGPVSGGKRDLSDSGTHVPFLIWGPPAVPAGTVLEGLVDITDVFSTVCAISNVNIPESVRTDGNSLLPQILQQQPSTRRWVHGSIGNKSSVFDGAWRLNSDGTLIDARLLPKEVPADDSTSEAKAARQRLLKALEESSSSRPTADDGRIVIDDEQAVLVGRWNFNDKVQPFIGKGYRHDSGVNTGCRATFTAKLTPGRYDVRLAGSPHQNRASAVAVTVQHAAGVAQLQVNQQKKAPDNARFIPLGTYDFAETGTVTLSNEDAGGYVYLDAVVFVPAKSP